MNSNKETLGNLRIKTFQFNPIQENTFVVYDETSDDCAIVDPGCFNDSEFSELKNFINTNYLRPVKLINTHCHFDHILGIERCRAEWNLKWEAHLADAFLADDAPAKGMMFGFPTPPVQPIDKGLNDGDMVRIGTVELKAIHVPGHSPGSLCYYCEDAKILIAGDVLFRQSIGRTDLEQGNFNLLISGIKEKLMTLPDNVVVFPGHGPNTTIGYEKQYNPYL